MGREILLLINIDSKGKPILKQFYLEANSGKSGILIIVHSFVMALKTLRRIEYQRGIPLVHPGQSFVQRKLFTNLFEKL